HVAGHEIDDHRVAANGLPLDFADVRRQRLAKARFPRDQATAAPHAAAASVGMERDHPLRWRHLPRDLLRVEDLAVEAVAHLAVWLKALQRVELLCPAPRSGVEPELVAHDAAADVARHVGARIELVAACDSLRAQGVIDVVALQGGVLKREEAAPRERVAARLENAVQRDAACADLGRAAERADLDLFDIGVIPVDAALRTRLRGAHDNALDLLPRLIRLPERGGVG